MINLKIKNLKVKGNQVFWTVQASHFGEIIERTYFTNENGEGIFEEVGEGTLDYHKHQLVGTCDFELKQKTVSGMRKALQRHYEL